MPTENIIRGPVQNIKEYSFFKILLEKLQNGDSKTAIVDGDSGKSLTFKDILQKSVSLAQHLTKMGIKPNDCISICIENSLNFPIPIFAAFYVGAIVNPLNVSYKQQELIHVLNISKPKVIFCSKSSLRTTQDCVKQLNYVEKIILMDDCDTAPESVLKFEDLVQLPLPNIFQIPYVEQKDGAVIVCSSGTTGFPKGVLLTDTGLISTTTINDPEIINFSSDTTILGLLPFFHIYGFNLYLNSIMHNCKLIILKKFEENKFLKSIQDYKVTYMPIVPQLALFLNESPLIEQYNLSSLKEITCGGTSLSKDVLESVTKKLNIKFQQGYGLSECPLASTTPFNSFKIGSIGKLIPGIECKIHDMESGQALGPNESGEMCLRGPMVMKGYVRNKQATDETIDKEGWLHTGDKAYYDEDNFFYIVGRYKELIKFKGFQVPPTEVECLLLKHPDVIDCGVVGKPHEKYGEVPVAFIVRAPDAKIVEKDIIKFVEENISYYKRLHGGVIFTNEIPKTALGKICRPELRKKLNTLQPESRQMRY